MAFQGGGLDLEWGSPGGSRGVRVLVKSLLWLLAPLVNGPPLALVLYWFQGSSQQRVNEVIPGVGERKKKSAIFFSLSLSLWDFDPQNASNTWSERFLFKQKRMSHL